ncbi:unnamed protein product [Paramecium pentaurelia]|uniref:Transmembrane protein n=1 Tax=Paramecium pentaurelia TaxID=43138 RepID=A0A8S1V9N3_9CILI|nr:unnamed protein product [Paramecium pentaurelia]
MIMRMRWKQFIIFNMLIVLVALVNQQYILKSGCVQSSFFEKQLSQKYLILKKCEKYVNHLHNSNNNINSIIENQIIKILSQVNASLQVKRILIKKYLGMLRQLIAKIFVKEIKMKNMFGSSQMKQQIFLGQKFHQMHIQTIQQFIILDKYHFTTISQLWLLRSSCFKQAIIVFLEKNYYNQFHFFPIIKLKFLQLIDFNLVVLLLFSSWFLPFSDIKSLFNFFNQLLQVQILN